MPSPEAHRRLMGLAIAAGHKALGRAWPNPAVGCVIAHDEQAIAQGWTGDGGRPHAEELALATAGPSARGAVAYVTLEPCCTRSNGAAACSTLLVEAGVRRVVVACPDPTANAGGGGLDRLRSAGIDVEVGLLAGEARELSEGFITRVQTGLPLVQASTGPAGYDAELQLHPGESLDAALRRYGDAGYTRLWTPRHGALAGRLAD